MATTRKHRRQWVELRPKNEHAALLKCPEEDPCFFLGPDNSSISQVRHHKYEFSTASWEIIMHDKPTDNLQKLLDLGYKEGASCRILDTLGLD